MTKKTETKKKEYIVNPNPEYKKHNSAEPTPYVLIVVPQSFRDELTKVEDYQKKTKDK